MPDIDHHREIGYVETEFDVQTAFTVTARPDGLEISGNCPACGGRTRLTLERGSPEGTKGWFRPRRAAEPPRTVTVFCVCGHMHADRPEDAADNGCGAFWSVELQ
ncbi:hypothetical protein SMC26_10605 [Actinomadura fulvescens]|uniref:Uncharacterized protein n=1 Tax=Actinomadura fulvescens TaxID=46160 RepID=A0ABP6CFA4_9ACTN